MGPAWRGDLQGRRCLTSVEVLTMSVGGRVFVFTFAAVIAFTRAQKGGWRQGPMGKTYLSLCSNKSGGV